MAKKFVFTQQKIGDLVAPKKRTYYRDIREPNLGVSVTPAGTKSFFTAVTINGSGHRITLGKFPALSVHVARQKTRETLVKISRGINPVGEKKRSRALSVTLRTVLDSYVEVKNLKPATVSNYIRAVDEAFADYLDKPLSKITENVFRKNIWRGANDLPHERNSLDGLSVRYSILQKQVTNCPTEPVVSQSIRPESLQNRA